MWTFETPLPEVIDGVVVLIEEKLGIPPEGCTRAVNLRSYAAGRVGGRWKRLTLRDALSYRHQDVSLAFENCVLFPFLLAQFHAETYEMLALSCMEHPRSAGIVAVHMVGLVPPEIIAQARAASLPEYLAHWESLVAFHKSKV